MFCCLSGKVKVPGKELCYDMFGRKERPMEKKERKRENCAKERREPNTFPILKRSVGLTAGKRFLTQRTNNRSVPI